MPKISVIVPVYKVEKYLERCVDSILNQTFTNFECILVDDGSPDNCGRICDEYAKKDSRVQVIHKQNGGLSDARNSGIDWAFENSDTEWLTFIDSDDWVHIKYLEILYKTAVNNDVKISSCGYIKVSDEDIRDEKTEDYMIDIDSPENMVIKGYKYNEYNFSITWGRLYLKDFFADIRFPKGRLHEDEFTTYKLLYSCGKIAVVKIPLYYYFQNDSGIMSGLETTAKICDRFEGIRGQIDFFYNNKFPISFVHALQRYQYIFELYLAQYSENKDYNNILMRQFEETKRFKTIYYDYLPTVFKKYGYKKWLTGRAFKLENLKNDIKNIKSEKGVFYAMVWVVKNYWEI